MFLLTRMYNASKVLEIQPELMFGRDGWFFFKHPLKKTPYLIAYHKKSGKCGLSNITCLEDFLEDCVLS